MKQKCCLILLGILVCFVGCRPAEVRTPPQRNLSFRAPITIQSEAGQLQGVWDSTLTETPVLSLAESEHRGELIYSQAGESVSISFSGLEQSFPLNSFPQYAIPRAIFEVFRICRLRPAEEEPLWEEGHWVYSGTYAELPFAMHTDSQGEIVLLTIGSQITVSFHTKSDSLAD